MTPGRHAIGQGGAPDARFADPSSLARELIARLETAGHGDRALRLRNCVVARSAEFSSGQCLSVMVLGEEGEPLVIGFAYLFLPVAATAHVTMRAAFEALGYAARQTATILAFDPAPRKAAA